MLTLADKKYFQDLVADLPTKKFVEETVSHLPTKEEFDKKMEYVMKLPTKEHFDERMDRLSGEIQDKRDEQILHQGQHDEIIERLETIEQKVGIQPL